MRFIAATTLALIAASAQAQAPQPAASPQPESRHSGAPLGQFTVGPLIVTPTFRIGTLAVDTNVQFQRERRADFVASAGPGLDLALPFLDHWKLDLQGTSEYYYFHRTSELRRWTGGGSAALFWKTTGTRAVVSARLNREFSRPNFEVDSRIATNQRFGGAELERDLGRLTLGVSGSYSGTRVEPGQTFRGADLGTSLTLDLYAGITELRYRLTPITSIVIEGGYQETRFPNATLRNFSEENAGLGLQTSGLFNGRVTAGVRRDKLLQGGAIKTQPYVRGDLTQSLGRRFQLTERYDHQSTVSAFATDGGLPTFERRSLDVQLAIMITRRFDMRLGGARDRTISDGLVQIVADDGSTVKAKRDDTSYIGRADLGLRLGRARVSIFGSYTTRDSVFFTDFGIKGFQAGARVDYAPEFGKRDSRN